MKIALSKRIVSFVLCLTVLLAGFAYKPQKAEAVAVTATVVASVAAIMTACGITYWANSQEDAVQYLGSKIDSYLWGLADDGPVMTYQEWLGVDSVANLFEVTANGAMKVGGVALQSILEFIHWFNTDTVEPANGNVINAGGSDVKMWLKRSPHASASDAPPRCTVTDSGNVTFYFDGDGLSSRSSYYVGITVPRQAQSVRVTVDSLSGYYPDLRWSVTDKANMDFGAVVGGASYQACDIGSNVYMSYIGSNKLLFIQFSGIDESVTYSFGGSLSFSWVDTPLVPHNVALQPVAESLAIPDVGVGDDLEVLPNVPLLPTMSVEQATDAILGGVASEEGLASEVDSGTQGGILEGWDWLSNILSSIRDFIAGIAQTVLGIPQAIGQAAQDVITGVGNAISTALYDAFVPSEAAIDAFVATLAANFDNHFSILSYPFSLLGRFVLEVVDAPGAHELVWPDIYEPFSGQRLIAAGSYNLDNALANENFRTAYDIYMTVIKGYIAFQFIAYLYAWFCDVFRMRNDDFANPIFEQEPIDDGPDDWDGYDSFFET